MSYYKSDAGITGIALWGLPDGRPHRCSYKQQAAVWRVWLAMVKVHAPLEEGVAVRVEDDGVIIISSVYSPLFEGNIIAVDKDGEVTYCSEQSAPDVAY